jgi:hypothetical protein
MPMGRVAYPRPLLRLGCDKMRQRFSGLGLSAGAAENARGGSLDTRGP